jgi:hypothetical protein
MHRIALQRAGQCTRNRFFSTQLSLATVRHFLLVWVVAPLNMIPAAVATTAITPRITSASFTTISQQSDPIPVNFKTVAFQHPNRKPMVEPRFRHSNKMYATFGMCARSRQSVIAIMACSTSPSQTSGREVFL